MATRVTIYSTGWRVRNTTGRHTRTDFTLDFTTNQLPCPARGD
ncbi:hypothetical protein [Micromonospora sp. NPDC050200]